MKTLIVDRQNDYFWSLISRYDLQDNFFESYDEGQVECVVIKTPTSVDDGFLKLYPKLKMIIRAGSGYDNIDLQLTSKKDIIVCNTPEANAISAFEHTMSFIFAMIKQHHLSKSNILNHCWKDDLVWNTEINELRVLVVGVGRIGTKVAQALKCLGAQVMGVDPYLTAEQWHQKAITSVDYYEGLQNANLITYHCPLTVETKYYFSADTLNLLKHPIWLVNTARGSIVSEQAIHQGLQTGRILGAGLDVFETEPNPDVSFAEYDNVYLTPHTGAYTEAAKKRLAEEVLKVWKSYVVKGNVINQVTK